MHKRWSRVIFSSRSINIILLVLQFSFLFFMLITSSEYSKFIRLFLSLLSICVALHIAIRSDKGAYKTPWMILVLLFPIFGGLFYLMFNFQSATRIFRKKIKIINSHSRELFLQPENYFQEIVAEIPEYAPQIGYLQNYAGYPIYKNTETKYLSPAEVKFEYMMQELKKAEKYIFLEYFIIKEGIMWNSILEVLKEKAAAGIDVRVIYDDMGCFFYLKDYYAHELSRYGIKCVAFNPFRPFLTVKQNNRDHRKIAVIDGKVAFTGGINLADEYMNVYEDQRYWKDASVMIRGEAAWSFTLMFLQMWTLSTNIKEDYEAFYPWAEEPCPIKAEGYVLPYADSPMDKENVGANVYLQIINNAQRYVYITTPYLIIDDSIINALSLAAKSGVDVRITTPHQSDSFLVHMTTRSYYRDLIEAGVKIYEYSRGIIHAKTFIADDVVGTVGTTNLDFRSLYLHFECGAWMYGTRAVKELKEDFLDVLNWCKELTAEDCNTNLFIKMFQGILRLFAPLM